MKQKSKLLEVTRKLLKQDKRSDYSIAVKVGVTPQTINNIRNSKGDSPGVVLVESLYELLSNKKLKV